MEPEAPVTTGQTPSWRAMLSAIPVRNAAAEAAEDGPNGLRVSVRIQPAGWWVRSLSWLLRRPPRRTVILDRLGSEVWELCDGARTVEQVVDEFAQRHALSFHEARVAVTEYLRELIQRGILAIGLPPEGFTPSGGYGREKPSRNTLPKV